MKGVLYLIPSTLGEDSLLSIPAEVKSCVPRLRKFIVENAKSARRFLKLFELEVPLQNLELLELKKTELDRAELNFLLQDLEHGLDVGLISEAGCPCVADPGAEIVREAHRRAIRVKPLVGPSSIMLALMASGLGGQNFEFVGYLPREDVELSRRVLELEKSSRASKKSVIFIETPYRSEKLFRRLLEICALSTEISLARNLSLQNESICTHSVAEFKKLELSFSKEPKDLCVMVLRAC